VSSKYGSRPAPHSFIQHWLAPCIFLLTLLGALGCVCPAVARDESSAPKYVTVPVYYLTDRNLTDDGYGNRRRYASNCLHYMYYGTAFITLENHNKEKPSQRTDTLGWKLSDEKAKDKTVFDKIDPTQPIACRREFFFRLRKALDQTGSSELCIYIHGAAEGFDDACLDAAELAYALHRPLVLYSWPSEPKLLDYVADNGNSEWSQGHFNLFCKHLLTFKKVHPLRLILIAHSMGNRFIFRGLHALYQSQLVCDCEFISPDIDIDTCRHYLMGYRKSDWNASVHLYVSNKDKMLKLSQKLFGGYARLGEDVQPNLHFRRPVEDLIVRKDAERKLEKSAPGPEGEDNAMENPEEAPATTVVERIDFTAIDKGLTGHSIPFQLVADMVDNRKSEGIEVVPDENDKSADRARIARPLSTAPPAH
jgi:esterase/lipase superfamily enzyme